MERLDVGIAGERRARRGRRPAIAVVTRNPLLIIDSTPLRFAATGVANVTVDVVGFMLLSQVFGASVQLANVVAFCLAIVTSYVLNSQWTFRGRPIRQPLHKNFMLFVAINLVGLCLSTALVLVLSKLFDGALAKLISVPVVMFYNYIAYSRLAFRAAPAR